MNNFLHEIGRKMLKGLFLQLLYERFPNEVPSSLGIIVQLWPEQTGGVAKELWVLHLSVHIEHVLLVGWGVVGNETEIAIVGRHYAVKVKITGSKCGVNIEEVSSFQSLVQGTDFRADKFIEFIG